jgi:tRNA (guanine-N7-)-methyltransferase
MESFSKDKACNREPGRLRSIRSFVLRGGRLTDGQKRALEELWPRFGVEPGDAELDFPAVFGNRNPVIIDIGFGDGESTLQMATASPGENLLAVEVHRPGVGHLLIGLETNLLTNVRIACADAVTLLRSNIPDNSLAGARLYFPDPWPKKRHHKRRIVQAGFIALLQRRIKPGGVLHMATDWAPYAEHMLEVLESSTGFRNCSASGGFSPRPAWRALTKYELRGQRMGHRVHDLIFRRTG